MKVKPITSWDDVPINIDLPMAAQIVGQTSDYLKQRSIKGNFPAYKEGSQWRVSKESLRKYIKQQEALNTSKGNK